MSIQEKENQVVSEFEVFEDWLDKYNYLIELGKTAEPLDEQYKTKNNLISGCQSRVWLHARMEDGRVHFQADSDAVITKGIVQLLIRVLSGEKPETIIESDLEYVDKLGLKEHLSPTRSNGLVSMIKQMKLYALAFKTKQEQGKDS